MYRTTIDNNQDILDSRDVIARFEELESERDAAKVDDLNAKLEEGETRDTSGDWTAECGIAFSDDWDEDRETEYQALKSLIDEADCSPDWHHGGTLIRDSYFEDYARQLAEDLGLLEKCDQWPATCIDWECAADELKQDYFNVDFDGVEYWLRA